MINLFTRSSFSSTPWGVASTIHIHQMLQQRIHHVLLLGSRCYTHTDAALTLDSQNIEPRPIGLGIFLLVLQQNQLSLVFIKARTMSNSVLCAECATYLLLWRWHVYFSFRTLTTSVTMKLWSSQCACTNTLPHWRLKRVCFYVLW